MSDRTCNGETPDGASPGVSRTEVSTFRLGDYGLIDVAGPPPDPQEVLRALLKRWADSPAGVVIRVETDEPPPDWTARAAAAAAALVVAWPGTPIAFISQSRTLRDQVARDGHGPHLVIGSSLEEIWGDMWSPGGKANLTVELPSTGQAPKAAQAITARACLDWYLTTVADPAARLADELVTRSVVHGAQQIRITVSRHQSAVRVLARDDVPSTTPGPRTIDDVFTSRLTTPALQNLVGSAGEFALDGHHVRWAVVHDPQPA